MSMRETSVQRPGFIVVLTGALYFAQGVPLGIAFSAYPTVLREAGASLAMLAWLPVVGLPWVLKFLWSPLVDNNWIASLGRRRTWLLSQQLLMIGAVIAMGIFPMTVERAPFHLALFALASVFAATQDIATDGLAAERLQGRNLLRANTLAVAGMILGMIVGGGGVLMAAGQVGVSAALYGLAVLLALCIVPTWLWREEVVVRRPRDKRASLLAVRRPGFVMVLAVAILFAAGHTSQASLTKLLMVDRQWSFGQIGSLETASHLAMLVLGCGVAPWAVARLGPWVSLGLSQLAIGGASLALLAVAYGWLQADMVTVIGLRSLGAAGAGLASVAGFTVMMLFARQGRQAGTDMTVFKSANVFGEIAAASAATSLAAATGYAAGFVFSVAAALLALIAACGASRMGTGSAVETTDALLSKGSGA